jgi:RimJ/RimL family protein N-acetyltransferase
MPLLVGPALPAGTFSARDQPRIDVDDRLVLRPWVAADAAVVRDVFADPAVQRWHVRRLDTDDEARDWVAAWDRRWTAETDASWAVAGRDGDRAVGQVGLRTVSLFEGVAQLSYWVAPAHRGTGVAVRAARALTAWGFGVGFHRLFLQHSMVNGASCRVAAKAGFPLEGTLRGGLRHADGWHDTHLHARLRTDG